MLEAELVAATGAKSADFTSPAYVLPVGAGYRSGIVQINNTTLTLPDGDDEVDHYLQTTFDDATTWVDMANVHFATADDGTTPVKLIVINPPAGNVTDIDQTDGTLANDTKIDVPFGSQLRIKSVTTGATEPTYAYVAHIFAW